MFIYKINLTKNKIPKLIILEIKSIFLFFFLILSYFRKMDLWLKEKNTLKWKNEKKAEFERNLKKLVENKVGTLNLSGKVFNSFLLLFLENFFFFKFFLERVSPFEVSLLKNSFHFQKKKKKSKSGEKFVWNLFQKLDFSFFFLREFSL